jgi:hypothetical protein
MNEIEKMYENAGIDRIGNKKCTPAEFSDCQNYCFISENNKCDKFSFDYPPFTAEKQIKLIELFISSIWWENLKSLYRIIDDSLNFKDKLAGIVNYLWISLSEEEKKQVKGILE